ncbi:MAG: GDP-mannose 4,6-dehydratase [Candidatus Aminicenantes bacterium]|nr:GDP-mannose 4,6-dehydratase [Candidatus Aminicenantes bacterium]
MRVLITGITGFAGSHLADYILANHPDTELFGVIRWRSRMENISHNRDNIGLCEGDLKDIVSLRKCLAEIKPDRIFHLAAQSFVPTSWKCPAETFAINAIGQINLFEAVLSLNLTPRIQIAGSSEEYGQVFSDELPMKETNPLRPLSPYAVSKVAQDLLAYQYFKSYGIRAVRTRGFNHTGPRRGEVFICSNFAKQIVEIEKKKRAPVIRVGNLETQRDFTDVRDTVRAYWLSLERGEDGEVYNIGSGKPYSMKYILDMLLSMSEADVSVEIDPERLRPSDVPILHSDCSKFHALTGWIPEIPLERSLQDLLDYWRERV